MPEQGGGRFRRAQAAGGACLALSRAWVLLVAVALVVAPAAAVAAKPRAKPTRPAEKKADRDDDKVFDDLEARIARAPEGRDVRVIVALSEAATRTRVRRLEREVGDFAVRDRFRVVDAFAATVTKRQVRALARTRGVVHVEHDSPVRAFNDSAQSSFGVTQARLDAPSLDGDLDGAPAIYSKDDLVAAVIDTGIDAGHQDLDEGKVIAFKDFVNGRTSAYDDEGHGTHVAGTIAGEGDARLDTLHKGAAPVAALVGVKVLDQNGSGYMSDVTAGIDWVVQNRDAYGVEAINLSLGTSGCSDGTDSTSVAVDNAHDAGIVVAVAAGNSGSGTCTIGSPGAAAKALTVGAMADMEQNGFKQAYWSSRGKTSDGRLKPDVSAPGVAITSAAAGTGTGYSTSSGTSMATPFVAGVALLMRDVTPGLTSQQVKAKVMQTALDCARGDDNKVAGTTGVDIDYGAGRLDAYAALASAGATTLTSPPPMPRHEVHDGELPGTGAYVDYTLDVSDTQFPIAATLIHPSVSGGSASSPDFDLYLYDPSGKEVARAYTTRRQEEVGFKPTATGKYTLRVKSYSGSGPYVVDVSAGTAPDTTAPSVTSVSPAEGATGVARNANVSVAFSEPMDKAATEGAFSLTAGDGTSVAGSLSWSGDTMTFDPSTDLGKGVEYTAAVGTQARDTAGNALAAEKAWTFTTTDLSTVTAFPSGTTILTGSLRSGDARRLGADDDSYYQVNSTTSGTRTTSWYGSFTGVPNGLASLKVSYKGKNSRTCAQTIAIWRFTDGTWVELDSRDVGGTEVAISELVPGGELAGYVSGGSGDGELHVRVRCQRSKRSFYASGDLLKVVYDG